MENALPLKAQVKNYWILKYLSNDECGFSYIAEDMNSNREVVLYEFFPRELVSRSMDNSLLLKSTNDAKEYKWRIDSITGDIKKLIALRHTALLKTIRFFSENETIYCVSEYKDAQTLKDYLLGKGGRVSEKEIRKIMLPLIDALHEMDRRNIVHKNINLKTILIDKNLDVFLGSYGLGVCNRVKNQDSCAFIPIEQCLMEERLGPVSDMYAFGAVLYTLVTGEKPIDAKVRNEAVKRGENDPLLSLKASSSYSEALCITINQALQLNSSKRAKSVTQLSGEYRKEISKVDPEQTAKIEKNKKVVSALPKSIIRIAVALFIGIIGLYIVVEKEKPKGAPDLFEAVERSMESNELSTDGGFQKKSSRESARLGYAYSVGEGLEKNENKAYKWTLKAAEEGDRYAMYNIGLAYLYGRGTEVNYMKAVRWFNAAYEKDVIGSATQLAFCYAKGFGVQKDLNKAIEYYKQDVGKNYQEAYSGLGWAYESNKNYTDALEMYKQVSGRHQGWAEARVGSMYQYGNGVNKNHFDAVTWYKKAAAHGSSFAMNKMGWFYEKGMGSTSRSYSNAFYWYEKAAQLGHAMGQTNLAHMYEKGWGVAKNLPIAIEWYKSAAQKGSAYAQKRLKKLGQTW